MGMLAGEYIYRNTKNLSSINQKADN